MPVTPTSYRIAHSRTARFDTEANSRTIRNPIATRSTYSALRASKADAVARPLPADSLGGKLGLGMLQLTKCAVLPGLAVWLTAEVVGMLAGFTPYAVETGFCVGFGSAFFYTFKAVHRSFFEKIIERVTTLRLPQAKPTSLTGKILLAGLGWLAGLSSSVKIGAANYLTPSGISSASAEELMFGKDGKDAYLAKFQQGVSQWQVDQTALQSRIPESEIDRLLTEELPGGFVETERGGKMHFILAGNPAGRKVLLMHGTPDQADIFRNQIRSLVKQGAYVLAPNIIGTGPSLDFPTDYDWSTPSQASTLVEVLTKLDFRTPDVVVKFSWGGFEIDHILNNYPKGTLGKPTVKSLMSYSAAFTDIKQAQNAQEDWTAGNNLGLGPMATRMFYNFPGLGTKATVLSLIGDEMPAADAEQFATHYSAIYGRDGHFGGAWLGAQPTRGIYGQWRTTAETNYHQPEYYAAMARNHDNLMGAVSGYEVYYSPHDPYIHAEGGTAKQYAEQHAADMSRLTGIDVKAIPIEAGHLPIVTQADEMTRLILK